MLIAFQSTGTRPPLFLVHGLWGFYTSDPVLVEAVGPDQPVYGINARGFDGAAPPCTSVREMAALYADEILTVHRGGRCLIGGLCPGGRAAIETARELMTRGIEVGPVLLLDPGTTPHKNREALEAFERGLTRPGVLQQLHVTARGGLRRRAAQTKRPLFDHNDVGQMEVATQVAVATSLALSRYVPAPFWGGVELIICSLRARNFFLPDHDWQRFLAGPRTVHVLEGDHMDLLETRYEDVHRLMRAYLDGQAEQEAAPRATQSAAQWRDDEAIAQFLAANQ
jgi:thioesterase domain-containing protein